MSVGIYVVNPASEVEKTYRPFAAESTFNEVILPAAQAVGAETVARFGLGLKVVVDEFPALEAELTKVLAQVVSNGEMVDYVTERTQLILDEMRSVWTSNRDAVFYIG